MSDRLYRYAIIGTGRQHGTEGATGFGMAHPQYKAFQATGRIELVALADIVEDNATAFREKYEQPGAKIYTDYHEMLAVEKPEVVSICTWPHLHSEMAVAACEAGVKAVHCEKPMATTWGDAKQIKAAADAHGTLVTFNHQRRFLEPFQKAKQMLQRRRDRNAAAPGSKLRRYVRLGHTLDQYAFFLQRRNAGRMGYRADR